MHITAFMTTASFIQVTPSESAYPALMQMSAWFDHPQHRRDVRAAGAQEALTTPQNPDFGKQPAAKESIIVVALLHHQCTVGSGHALAKYRDTSSGASDDSSSLDDSGSDSGDETMLSCHVHRCITHAREPPAGTQAAAPMQYERCAPMTVC
jgi:hypothetical protein